MGSRSSKWVAGLVCILFLGCGSEGGNGQDAGEDGGVLPCDLGENACPEGKRCTQEQECVDADPLTVVTESLPDGRVGFGYSQDLEATGGLPPYSWSISGADPELGFLSISTRGRLEGTTDQPVNGASITVAVTDDGYGGGETATRTFTLSFESCRDGDKQLCYAPEGGTCHQGERTCTGGEFGPCVPGVNLSSDRRYCGPECLECDQTRADSCVAGLCTCGGTALCQGDDWCCLGECTSVEDNPEHCGSCNRNCRQLIAHAENAAVSCAGGVCDYTGSCDRGWLDCDSNRENGCEQAVTTGTCGACDVDCRVLVTHVPGSEKTCVDTGSEFVCDYTGECVDDFGDCDLDRSNGCETYFNTVEACGSCDLDCRLSAAGDLCLSPDPLDPYAHECGCRYDGATGLAEGCDAGQVCCDSLCHDAETDGQNCGVCGAVCPTGVCQGGACGCSSDADCPSPSSATACGGPACVCSHAGSGDAACPAGQHCCDGQAGGSGGPDEGADIGCCPRPCSQNNANLPCVP